MVFMRLPAAAQKWDSAGVESVFPTGHWPSGGTGHSHREALPAAHSAEPQWLRGRVERSAPRPGVVGVRPRPPAGPAANTHHPLVQQTNISQTTNYAPDTGLVFRVQR